MKIHLRTIGCRLNQSEIDRMARQFRQQGHEVVEDPAHADWFVVNTCAVTQDASRSSRQTVRELSRANPDGQITVTGCYAQLAPDETRALPNVALVVDNLTKDQLVEKVTGVPAAPFDAEPLQRDEMLPGASGRTRAFVKVQDGCDNRCTFCVTTVARGAGRSRPQDEVIAEIRYLHEQLDYKEAVLTGVHLGSYGHDAGERQGLAKLVRAILTETGIPRLRLSSLEPWDIAPEFFEMWENPRLCPHLHLPLQSGCDMTLKRMLRHTTQADFRALIEAARRHIPHVNITSDIIVGFPGETDDEFEISTAYIEEMNFAGLHVFRYSRRPGTAAVKMRGHVSEAVKKARSARLQRLADEMTVRFATSQLGQTRPVLWEHIGGATQDGFINLGYTDNYIRVRGIHPRVLTNHLTPARLETYENGIITARPLIE